MILARLECPAARKAATSVPTPVSTRPRESTSYEALDRAAGLQADAYEQGHEGLAGQMPEQHGRGDGQDAIEGDDVRTFHGLSVCGPGAPGALGNVRVTLGVRRRELEPPWLGWCILKSL